MRPIQSTLLILFSLATLASVQRSRAVDLAPAPDPLSKTGLAPGETLGFLLRGAGQLRQSVVPAPDVWDASDVPGKRLSAVASLTVICVPWQGDTTKYHTTLSGGGGRLKGVIKTPTTDTYWYQWVYGDGGSSAPTEISGQTWYTVDDPHAYAGADGTPFTAQLCVADNDGMAGAVCDPYLVKIEHDNLDARINIAIDDGLWYIYGQGQRRDGVSPGDYLTFDGSPFVFWSAGGYPASATAARWGK